MVFRVAGAGLSGSSNVGTAGGRLTLESGVPISNTNQLAKTQVFLTPYKGNIISLWDGDDWVQEVFSQLTVAVPNTTNTPFDLFQSMGGVLQAVNWTNATTRATAISYIDGVLVQTTNKAKLFRGTGCTTAVAGQTELSNSTCFLWNFYNQEELQFVVNEATPTWNYSIDTWHQANGSANNQFNFVLGTNSQEMNCDLLSCAVNDTAVVVGGVGIGLDTTSADSSTKRGPGQIYNLGLQVAQIAQYKGFPGQGKHFLSWNEKVAATGITTWVGATTHIQSGLSGSFYA